MKGLGWKPDLPDFRDFKYTTRGVIKRHVELPDKVDLRDKCPAIRDQGELGSCTAHAVTSVCEFLTGGCNSKTPFNCSPLFLYYCTRVLENTVDSDAGATIRDTVKALNQTGVSDEQSWPYIIEKFATLPTREAFEIAEHHQAISYERLSQTAQEMMTVLAEGYPFVFGFSVYESFYNIPSTYIAELPSARDSLLGGHAVMAVGYLKDAQLLLIRNSWGKEWGIDGYFYLPFSYVTDRSLAADFWIVKEMESESIGN